MRTPTAERSRRFRQKLKQNAQEYEAYKLKAKERKQLERNKNIPKSKAEQSIQRRQNRERVSKFRLKKIHSEIKSTDTAYKTPQALGKAVSKVKRQLPSSPRKKRAVIEKLVSLTKIQTSQKSKTIPAGNRALSNATEERVRSFYQKDCISQLAAGRKDYVITRSKSKKVFVQKRYLLYSLRETFALFKNDNPSTLVGLSKFSSLRPTNVKLLSETPKNTCLCLYHENIRQICDCLSKVVNFPAYTHDFVNNAVCDVNSESCMMGKCSSCPKWIEQIIEQCSGLDTSVSWFEWERVQTDSSKTLSDTSSTQKHMKKLCKIGTVQDVFNSLKSKLPFFLQHVFLKLKQVAYFEEITSNIADDEAVLQVDFSENYSCRHQDEIQAAHWNYEQVTLFPIALWMKDYGKGPKSFVIVSDELKHDKMSVAVFITMAIQKFVKEKNPNIKKVCIFSDGPSSQFKNKYIAKYMQQLSADIDIQWNFFASGHGKGPVDGIGGSVKRTVWRAVQSRKAFVNDSKSFFDNAKTLNRSISILYLGKITSKSMVKNITFKNVSKGQQQFLVFQQFIVYIPQMVPLNIQVIHKSFF